MEKPINQISKFLSYILRHKPEAIGLTLDVNGWADIDELLDNAKKYGEIIDKNLLYEIVSQNDKKRFTISDDGMRIRAEQGHSTKQVDIDYIEKQPPRVLYHGTASRFLNSILHQGLISGNRHYVHLSDDIAVATEVGKRYGNVVMLEIKAEEMYQQGFQFYLTNNNVWLTKEVPSQFLNILDLNKSVTLNLNSN